MTDPSQIGRKPRPANADRPPRSPLGELLTPTPDELAILVPPAAAERGAKLREDRP